ncbi:unnamed protein product [Linum tenue]|uniref:F-box domain-containing protein n=1 Tax=Linum tenue TaxID=586396 RepID=A0AAV0GTN0_9ROSI|nr:unnamed protein product [Linum tenue]
MSRKRRLDDGAEVKDDRVSDLSDDILYHILSSLDDTKLVVQTSVLSKRWRDLWKDVGVLNLNRNSFSAIQGGRNFVRNFLRLRSQHATIHKVSFTSKYTRVKNRDDQFVLLDNEPLEMVLGHAAGRTKHRESSLEALELVDCYRVDLGSISGGCRMLTTLELRGCEWMVSRGHDPFANIPLLRCLKLLDCSLSWSSDRFKVTGLQLLRLEIRSSKWFSISQVLSPKLESFCFTTHVSHMVELPELNLPSLDRATVRMVSYPYAGLYNELGWCSRVAVKFLQGLRNVKSLDLYFEDVVLSLSYSFTPRIAVSLTSKMLVVVD